MRLLSVLYCLSATSCVYSMEIELQDLKQQQCHDSKDLLQGDELDSFFQSWRLKKNPPEPVTIEGIEPLPLCSTLEGGDMRSDKSGSLPKRTVVAHNQIFERRLKLFNVLREKQLLADRATNLEEKLQDACLVVNTQEEELKGKKKTLARCEMIYNDMKLTIDKTEKFNAQLDSENKRLRADTTLMHQELEFIRIQKEKNCCNSCPIL